MDPLSFPSLSPQGRTAATAEGERRMNGGRDSLFFFFPLPRGGDPVRQRGRQQSMVAEILFPFLFPPLPPSAPREEMKVDVSDPALPRRLFFPPPFSSSSSGVSRYGLALPKPAPPFPLPFPDRQGGNPGDGAARFSPFSPPPARHDASPGNVA